MALNDAPHNVWRGDYDLYSTGSLAINMCARDLSKNGSCINKNFVSSLMLASSGGTALSTDGACEVKMLGGVVKKDAYVLIFETASDVAEGGAGYEISPTALALGGFVEIGIAYAEEETEPEHLCLARLDDGQVSFVDSYLDRDASRVVAFVSRLGVCGLVRRSDALTPDYGAGGLRVFQNTPNPFVNSTVLTFEASRAGKACVDVVSVDGRVVRNLFSGMVGPGRHEVRWDGRDNGGRTAAGGVYLYKVEFDSKTTTRKMVNLR